MTIPENKYLGKLCKRGHDWNGTGKSLRMKSGSRQGSSICAECKKISGRKSYWKNREKNLEKRIQYRKEHREEQNKKQLIYYKKHKVEAKIYNTKYRDEKLTLQQSRLYSERYRENNREKVNRVGRENARKCSKILTDGYIKGLLRVQFNFKGSKLVEQRLKMGGIKYENITPELMQQLIRLKRIEIKLKRQIRENNKCQISL